MESESARATTAAESRYRVKAPNSQPRTIKVIALDEKSERVVKALSDGPWNRAVFLTASAFERAPQSGDGFAGWLSDVAGRTTNLVEEIATADLVVMVATAGQPVPAASLIGEACSLKRVMTTALVLGGSDIPDDVLSQSLAQLRPWALMLVIASAEDYVADMLMALRA